jgi:glycosyltransferase involved in cell wall biosynthesis
MKVVFASGIYPPDIGGPATYVHGLASAMANRNFECEVVSYASRETIDSPATTNQVNVSRVDRQSSLPVRYGRFFLSTLRACSDEALVYAQDPISAGLPAMLAARARRRPFVLKVVGDLAWEIARERDVIAVGIDEFQSLSLSGLVARLRSVEAYVARHATRIITPSEYLEQLVSGWGVPKERIEVIHNAVEENVDQSDTGDDSDSDSDLDGEPTIVTVGRLVPWKGFDTLLEAFARIASRSEAPRLHIVGSGPMESKLRRRIEDLGIGSRVRMRPSLERSPLRRLLGKADIFVLASTYEGFSHVLLEAMREGTFVIASNAGGNPELVVDGESGLLVEPSVDSLERGLERAIRDEGLRARLAKHGRERAEQFRWNDMVERTVALLQSVAAGEGATEKSSR